MVLILWMNGARRGAIIYLLMGWVLLCFSAGSLVAQQQDSVLLSDFDAALHRFGSLGQLSNASWSFYAVDVSTGERYRGVNEHLALVPASTLKPFTSGAVLSILGSHYRFRTDVCVGGKPDSAGVLHGNVYLIGGGDPTLGSDRFGPAVSIDTLFLRILQALHLQGIVTINGSVIGDGSVFGPMPVIPSWQYEDIGNHYGAGAFGLSVHDNRITYIFEPGRRAGDPVRLVGTRPEVPYMQVVNEVTTGPRGSGDRVNVYGGPFSHQHWLRGTVPAGVTTFEVSGAMPDPVFHAAFALHEYLSGNGITILRPPTTQQRMVWMGETDTQRCVVVYEHLSPPLSEIVYWVNFRSVNMYTEALVKILGRERGGDGTTEAGLREISRFWTRRGVDLSGLSLKDGSGLSRKNVVTTATLAGALVWMQQDPVWEPFFASFPVAGESGTVANRFRRSAARGNLRAKSGTLENVRCFSGYATTTSGRTLAYALIVNHYNGSRNDLMDEMEILLTKLCEITD
jgi:serine-type D-Ala-D-Ala carboxypeptidase/endopeptidase (penicillin-binding protein 4)